MSGFVEPKFFIKSGDVGFSNRQKDILDLLNVAEKEKINRQSNEVLDPDKDDHEPMEVSITPTRTKKTLRKETRQFRGKESIFKRPEAPPPRFNTRNIPDFQRNPHRWTKYSLGDVSQEDMSEKSNTAAALSFLRELEARKSLESVEEARSEIQIVFKPKRRVVPAEGEGEALTDSAKSSFRSSKVVMPEYVVGQEKKKTKKNLKRVASEGEKSSKSIKLSHLEEEDFD